MMDKPAIHDIRLLFHVEGIRNILLRNNNESIIDEIDKNFNKDIKLKDIVHDDIVIKTTVYHTENVSVIITCSDNPIEIQDPVALSKLTGGLTEIEERLQQEINHYPKLGSNKLTQERPANFYTLSYELDCQNVAFWS